jgi:hypothetical protein
MPKRENQKENARKRKPKRENPKEKAKKRNRMRKQKKTIQKKKPKREVFHSISPSLEDCLEEIKIVFIFLFFFALGCSEIQTSFGVQCG